MTEDTTKLDQPAEAGLGSDQSLDEAASVRYLAPDDFLLFKGEAGGLRLTLKDEKSVLRVRARRCFPFAFPSKFISLRDGNEEEIGIIHDLALLPKDYRRWIEEDLHLHYYAPSVVSIKTVNQRYGGIEWYVETDRGSRRLITKAMHDALTEIEQGRYILTDVDGNRFELFTEQMDEPSRAKLAMFI